MKKNLYTLLVVTTALIAIFLFVFIFLFIKNLPSAPETITSLHTLKPRMFIVESIDTMKYSRDMAHTALNNQSFDSVIDAQMQAIANTGANYVAIDTPYDEEFIPVLIRWVDAARKYHLSIFFRGNFSGWEGWFEYAKITPAQHEAKLKTFLTKHVNLFQNGDIFIPCTECENGGPGDPRKTNATKDYQNFLATEDTLSANIFQSFGKNVMIYPNTGADTAKQTITSTAMENLGGTILIDDYTSTSDEFSEDISTISTDLNATVGLGEFGGPIPEFNGDMTDDEQAQLVQGLLSVLYEKSQNIPIINYWDVQGGSTALLNPDGSDKPVYDILKNYYSAPSITGIVTDSLNKPLSGVTINVASTTYSVETDDTGFYQIFLPLPYRTVTVSKEGYATNTIIFPENLDGSTQKSIILYSHSGTLQEKASSIYNVLLK